MGGDDLESEDEYLDQSWAINNNKIHKLQTTSTSISQLVVDDSIHHLDDDERGEEEGDSVGSSHNGRMSKKRSLNAKPLTGSNLPPSNKKQRRYAPKKLLLDASKGIANEERHMQAAFLWTSFTHFLKLNDNNIKDEDKFTDSHFIKCNPKKDKSKSSKDDAIVKKKSLCEKSIVTFLKSGTISSMKKLKKWKFHQSPMVLIMCISARRAVALLKDLSSLNLRVAKLFAKHMDIVDQIDMLEQNSYGIAVCTPNRLLKLFNSDSESNNNIGEESDNCEKKNSTKGGAGALSLDRTELLVIDCHEDNKQFTVCTMNDTAPDLMKFIKDAVLPQIKKRKTIKFAMF